MRIVRNRLFIILGTLGFAGLVVFFFYVFLRPATARDLPVSTEKFEIKKGESFGGIVDALESSKLLRAPKVFKLYLVLSGSATRLKPGEYELDAHLSSFRIAQILRTGPDNKVFITIPEGSSVFEIDKLLSEKKVFGKGDLVRLAQSPKSQIEGKLFPDSYEFYINSGAEEVVKKMTDNFNVKAAPLLGSKGNFNKNLILASLLEKEVPNFEERRIVAGILVKRVALGIPLQVDSTLCYIKKLHGSGRCYPLTQNDFKKDSPYNTYLYPNWPSGAISNPGIPAIRAALSPETTGYLYYLSDPATGKTIFSDTLDSHNANRVKYLISS